jgi:outer membrane protein OmpA-like peptidoglycan-associated protein
MAPIAKPAAAPQVPSYARAMRIGIAVCLLACFVRVGIASPPSGYQCAPGKPKAGVGCACPGGYAEKRDAEDVATCAAVAGDSSTTLFVKALERGDLAKAATLASKLDGSTDTRATTALTTAFDTWLAGAKREVTAHAAKGKCPAIGEALKRGLEYRQIWANLMQRLDKRNPAMQAGAMATGRVDQQLAPIKQAKETCTAARVEEPTTAPTTPAPSPSTPTSPGSRLELPQQVMFEFNRPTIKPVSFPMLDEVVATLRREPGLQIEVQGHTDSMGNREMNLKLSQTRADAVREYLVRKGIDGGRIAARGYGEDVPIADNRTAAGRAQNRRMELVIVGRVASGRPAAKQGASPPASSALEQARRLYEEGDKAYNLADFDRAIDAFKRAYALAPKPELLFNLGQAYRQKGDRTAAIEYYERFLGEAPNNRSAADVRRKIEELRKPPRPPGSTD